MEFSFTCTCGKVHNVSITDGENKSKATLITKTAEPVSWFEIADAIHNNTRPFNIGDEIHCTLKDDRFVEFVVAAVNPYGDSEVAFVLKDCLGRHEMNSRNTNEGGYAECDMAEYMNELCELLPDDLKAVIKPRTITQHIDDEEYSRECTIWLPSLMELTGKDWAGSDSEEDVHFPLFEDERSRVKQIDGETCYWWTRSPYAGSSYNFCYVNTNGDYYSGNASGSYGVAFGFLI